MTVSDSTIADNDSSGNYFSAKGGGIRAAGDLVIINSTITGNFAGGGQIGRASGGGH